MVKKKRFKYKYKQSFSIHKYNIINCDICSEGHN